MQVLLVEDDLFSGGMLVRQLQKAGYIVDWLTDGSSAVERIVDKEYDIIILDWVLPGQTGIDVCAKVRCLGKDTPILMLTSKDAVSDRVVGLDCGADDYALKPCPFPEMNARIRALVRRFQNLREKKAGSEKILAGNLEYYPAERMITAAGESIYLSKMEATLFELLLRHAGHPISRERVALSVWEGEPSSSSAVDTLISLLRRRLTPIRHLCRIDNERGRGFTLHV